VNQILVDLIAGARPNFIKIAPLMAALQASIRRGSPMRARLIHTGQHYDRAMSADFFDQLGIPDPDVNLEVGSGSQAEQTAGIMVRYEKVLLERRSNACLVVGDVNSTMACAITARKLGVPVGHVEGGIRSDDWTMPEEINRVVTDSVTNWFFTTSETANANLRRSGIDDSRIFFVGNTMIDTLVAQQAHLRPPSFWDAFGLAPSNYLLLTLHRPANVDDAVRLAALLSAIVQGAGGAQVIFPVHPRTAKQLNDAGHTLKGLRCIGPLPYREFTYLLKQAKAVVTDSGGITEEATVFGVPCLTVRDNTERPETVTVGTNELVGTNPAGVERALRRVVAGEWKKGGIPELWDGKAATRIVDHLERLLGVPAPPSSAKA
jgi:UDP-N-acetylglucosamine 2-epimerase (non-hydrolysing)